MTTTTIDTYDIDRTILPPTLAELFPGEKIPVKVTLNEVILTRSSKATYYNCPILGIFKDDPIPMTLLEEDNDLNKRLES